MNANLPIVWDEGFVNMFGKLRRYVTQLQSQYPIDQLGRPMALVNPQAILATGFLTPIDEMIDNPPQGASLPISYLEGLPTIYGMPIWEKLEGEKPEFYELFKRYRSMKDAKTQRAVYKLAVEAGIDVKHLELVRQTYHWNARVNAFDEYLAKERAVQLELRRIEIEGKHAGTGAKLYKMAAKYLEDHEELLTPKVAMEMLDMAIKLERVSIGFNPDKRQDSSTVVNVQTNVSTAPTSTDGLITGNLTDDKTRLVQVLNVMNKIGLMTPDAVDAEEIIEEDE